MAHLARIAACQLWLRGAVRRVGLVGQFLRGRSSPQFRRSVTRAGVSPNLSDKRSWELHSRGTAEVGPSANLGLSPGPSALSPRVGCEGGWSMAWAAPTDDHSA